MTTGDVPSTVDFVINQTTFYLTLLITLGSAGAIIAQVIRGVNGRIQKTRDEAEARSKAADDAIQKEVDEIKKQVDFIYWRIVERFFDERQQREGLDNNGTTRTKKEG